MRKDVRIWVGGSNQDLFDGASIVFSEGQTHYLSRVMRIKEGMEIKVFDGFSGEWWCRILDVQRNSVSGEILECRRGMKPEPDVWLLFSPVKGDATETIVQKATELGASKIVPLSTQRTVVKAIKTERLRNIMVEAAEQCERLTCPVLEEEEAKVVDIVGKWPEDRMLILCDETAVSSTRETVLNNMYTQSAADKKAGILIGPEVC